MRLQSAGGQVLMEPMDVGRMAVVADDQGTVFSVISVSQPS